MNEKGSKVDPADITYRILDRDSFRPDPNLSPAMMDMLDAKDRRERKSNRRANASLIVSIIAVIIAAIGLFLSSGRLCNCPPPV